jgi:hypothetical protein
VPITIDATSMMLVLVRWSINSHLSCGGSMDGIHQIFDDINVVVNDLGKGARQLVVQDAFEI